VELLAPQELEEPDKQDHHSLLVLVQVEFLLVAAVEAQLFQLLTGAQAALEVVGKVKELPQQ
jgi:hypothetical protein